MEQVLKVHCLHTSSAFCYHPGMRSTSHATKLLRLIKKQPAVSARELSAAGIPARAVSRMAARGQLHRVGRGLYTGVEATPSVHQSVIEVTKQAPKAVVCLLSALEIHEVGVQAPFEVWIALPAGTHAPKGTGTAIRVTRLSGAAFSEGIETVVFDGAPVRVYSLAKTITDCFKLRSKVGLDVALEALREAWKARKVTMDDLARYAKVNRMTNVMRPYIEALTG
jgi:predicted transcriptional regulator of viral defense system